MWKLWDTVDERPCRTGLTSIDFISTLPALPVLIPVIQFSSLAILARSLVSRRSCDICMVQECNEECNVCKRNEQYEYSGWNSKYPGPDIQGKFPVASRLYVIAWTYPSILCIYCASFLRPIGDSLPAEQRCYHP